MALAIFLNLAEFGNLSERVQGNFFLSEEVRNKNV
jgi:hypothetical protein